MRLTQRNLSSHLAKLEQAGYVEIEKKFKVKPPLTICCMTEAGKKALGAYSSTLLNALTSSGASAESGEKR